MSAPKRSTRERERARQRRRERAAERRELALSGCQVTIQPVDDIEAALAFLFDGVGCPHCEAARRVSQVHVAAHLADQVEGVA